MYFYIFISRGGNMPTIATAHTWHFSVGSTFHYFQTVSNQINAEYE
uniref:Uncharacterized protein n=1 Tax=Anguilla anguilla TaxID=7936 RepID=A0A0E9SYF0_ANGAN